MNDTHPKMDSNMNDKVLSVAPGEGKVPVDLLYDHDWDIKAFPHLNNPDGKNGLFQKDRPVKLTHQQFFNHHILNVDKRFARHPPYLFAAVHYLEKKQIRQNMNLSYTTGHKSRDSNGKVNFHHHDGYVVLNNIKNSPTFMRKKKLELLAKLDNFGPFHWFFTLSCADKRWENIWSAILRELPELKDIKITKCVNENGFAKLKLTIELEDGTSMTLDDFKQHMKTNMRDAQEAMIRDNVLTATRVFDQRVKTFMKDIVMGKDNPMNVLLYTYRVEFQQRGAAHVHGVLWMDMSKMDKMIPGLKKSYDKLRHDQDLKDPNLTFVKEGVEIENNVKPLVEMVDMFVTCSLHSETAGGADVVLIAKETQTHHHTRSCKKKSLFAVGKCPNFHLMKLSYANLCLNTKRTSSQTLKKPLKRSLLSSTTRNSWSLCGRAVPKKVILGRTTSLTVKNGS